MQSGGSVYGIRVVAYIIDAIILGIAGFILSAILGAITASSVNSSTLSSPGAVTGILGLQFGFLISDIAITLLYGTLLIGSASGKTVGMRVMGLRVQDANTGASIGYGRAFIRWLVFEVLFMACVIPGLINLLSPLWDPRGQTWHDKAANSIVVRG